MTDSPGKLGLPLILSMGPQLVRPTMQAHLPGEFWVRKNGTTLEQGLDELRIPSVRRVI